MQLDRYEFKGDESLSIYEFLSEGRKGQIVKVVKFEPMNIANFFNLAFGDKVNNEELLDDTVITDNGDAEKVLATVVATVYSFSHKFPGSWIYATGSSASRNRLYRMGLNKYLDLVFNDFDVMGQIKNEWENYVIGRDYQAFAVRRKRIKFDL